MENTEDIENIDEEEEEGSFDGQKKIPHLTVPLIMYDIKEYMKWLGTAESRVWFVMNRHIVRGKMKSNINKMIRTKYYLKGKLAMHKDLKSIAEFLDLKSEGYVSEIINSMIKKGIIIRHFEKSGGRSVRVFELGVHDSGPYVHENLHLFNYFIKLQADLDLENKFK